MASVSAPADLLVTVNDILRLHPDIPVARVRFSPAPGTATEADVVHIRNREKRLFELVDGILVEKAMGSKESLIAINISTEIRLYTRTHPLGVVLGADGMLRLKFGVVRMPDVSFISWKRLPGSAIPEEPVWELPPDFAVEVLSVSNTDAEIDRKLQEYFEAGTALAWIVDPESELVRVHTSPTRSKEFARGETLDGGNVLPEFSMTVDAVFAI